MLNNKILIHKPVKNQSENHSLIFQLKKSALDLFLSASSKYNLFFSI